MNTTDCEQGLFRDELLFDIYAKVNPNPTPCVGSVYAFLVTSSVIIATRIVISFMVWIAWFQNRNRLKQIRRSLLDTPIEKRIPFIPTASSIGVLMQLILLILFSLNVLNQKEYGGVSICIMYIWLLQVCIIQLFTLRKVVALGSKIFRFKIYDIPSSDSSGHVRLSRFDCNLKVLLVLMVILVILSTTFISIEVFVGDQEISLVFIRAALSCLTLEQFFLYGAMIYQYERCVRFVRDTLKLRDTEVQSDKEMVRSMKKMRYQQIVMLITGLGQCGILLYWAIVLSLPWWIVPIAFLLDCFVYGMMVLSLLKLRKSRGIEESSVGGQPKQRKNDELLAPPSSSKHQITSSS